MRMLTDRVGAELRKALQGYSKILVSEFRNALLGHQKLVLLANVPSDSKSHMLASDFYDVLLESGWPVEEPVPMHGLSPSEVQIGVADCDNPPRCAQFLLDALKSSGVQVPIRIVRWGKAGRDQCCLMVGNCENSLTGGE
jgi:hypothetical protein